MIKEKYKTEQRKELLEYMIENNDKYLSAEDIQKEFINKNVCVGLTTIYRFLKYLENQGRLRIEIKEHTKYYQYISEECHSHFHLKCKECGKVIHFNCDEMKEFNEHLSKHHDFKIDTDSMIYGTCRDCQKINERNVSENE